MQDRFVFYSSGVFSFVVYGGVLLALLSTFNFKNITKYASQSQSQIAIESIQIDAILDDNILKGEKLLQVEEAYAPLEGAGVKDAFASIDSPNVLQDDTPPEDRAKEAINKKSDEDAAISDILAKSQELEKQITALNEIKIGINASSRSDGAYDEWYAKIDKIISQNWQDSTFYQYATARVVVIITNKGKFDYKILKASGILSFDNSLKNTLEKLRNIDFPPYEKGAQTSIEVIFTKGEKTK